MKKEGRKKFELPAEPPLIDFSHMGVFFGIALALVLANVFSLGNITTRFLVLAAELIILPGMFSLMRSTRNMWIASMVVPLVGFIVCVLGMLWANDLWNLRVFALVQLAITFFLVVGLVKVLVRKHEINFQTVMGAASLYVLVGLLFARLYYVMDVFRGPFFDLGDRAIVAGDFVYYSFVTLTTIGYGDLTAAGQYGRLISVVEAILGQLYLVVVIAFIVGSFSANLGAHMSERRKHLLQTDDKLREKELADLKEEVGEHEESISRLEHIEKEITKTGKEGTP